MASGRGLPSADPAADTRERPDQPSGGGGGAGQCQCDSCGRSFSVAAIARHTKVCTGEFGQKRRSYDVAAQRLDGTLDFVSPKGGGTLPPPGTSSPAQGDKWKRQSEQLRSAMRTNRVIRAAVAQGEDATALEVALEPGLDDRVPCPHCGRKFSERAAERHVPRCVGKRTRASLLAWRWS